MQDEPPDRGPARAAGGAAERFLLALWPGELSGRILIWSQRGKRSHWLANASEAAKVVERIGADVYVGVGLSPEDLGARHRCPSDRIVAVPGLWADIDIAGPAHKKLNLPPTEEAALELVPATGLRPTLIVHSGHGLQLWWLLSEILEFGDSAERQRFAELAAGWQLYLQGLAHQRGWVIDSVGDLARVLRAPGTLNAKIAAEPVAVRLLSLDGPRYTDLAEFEERCAPLISEAAEPESLRPIELGELRADSEPPAEKFNVLCALEPEFASAWDHTILEGRKDSTPSAIEQTLANFAAHAGWSDGEIAALVISHRRRWDPAKLSKLLGRQSYLARTIGRARLGSERSGGGVDLSGVLGEELRQRSRSGAGAPPTPEPSPSEPREGKAKRQEWPASPVAEAYYGLAGEIVEALSPHTEADPVALLAMTLAAFGSAVGRGPHFQVGGDTHRSNLFVALVGSTSTGRKGSSAGPVRGVFREADPVWAECRIVSGMSSGEGLIWQIRDPITCFERRRGKGAEPGDPLEEVVKDPGVDDKRLLVLESELAQALKAMARTGNTLSPIVRCAWDGVALQALTKNSPAACKRPYVAIVGHITPQELRANIREIELASGFLNRFMLLCVRRSRLLPDGGALSDVITHPL